MDSTEQRGAVIAGPEGARLTCTLEQVDLPGVIRLLENQYWLAGIAPDEIARAHLGSSAWAGAHDENGELIATARAISDGARYASIHDVAVAEDWRGRGLGRAVFALLLDHPRLRHTRTVMLATRDAQSFYASFGFVPRASPSYPEMILVRNVPLVPARQRSFDPAARPGRVPGAAR
jgi:N-acetylglutamate synthase-like GNAT family acetyltransferase